MNGATNGAAHGPVAVAVKVESGGAAAAAAGASTVTQFEAVQEVVVQFNDICCWVPKLAANPPTFSKAGAARLVGLGPRKDAKQSKEEMRQVLFEISGSCEPGEMLALMGPSGGGKTTLLSILGGRTPKQTRAEGQVSFNGARITKRVKRQIGFVLQDDLLYATLTVFETLLFAAMLRLPKYKSKAEKVARVEAVIKALGLTRCRDTIIGDHLRRGVSGGERKRVSVGHELLINPAILLLDEPTSGLDSSAARKLVELLRELASAGRCVITTIHQPSSNIYRQLDTVLLLSQGHPIFYGKGGEAAHWFDRLGFACPFGTNIADWILDLASGEVAGKHPSGEEARLHLIACSEQFLEQEPGGYCGGELDAFGLEQRASSRRSSHALELQDAAAAAAAAEAGLAGAGRALLGEADSTDEEVEGHATAAVNGNGAHIGALPTSKAAAAAVDIEAGGGSKRGSWLQRGGSSKRHMLADRAATGLDRTATGLAAAAPGASRWGASYWTQFSTLFIRAVRVRRFETLSRQDFFQFVTVGLVCGMIWWQVGQKDTLYAAENTRGLLFFEGLFLCFRTMFTSLFVWPNEQKMMLKERASGMYRLSAFYLARTASDIPADLSVPSIFIAIIYLMGGLRHGGYFFLNWLTVLLSTLVAQTLGLLIGATVMVVKTAQTVAAVLMLTFMLVGGFYVTNIPVWIAWIKWLSFLTYTFSLLLKIEFAGRDLWDCSIGSDENFNPSDPWNYVASGQCEPVKDLNDSFNTSVALDSPPWEAAALVGMLLAFRLAVYIALRKKTQ
ncbi:hypothetical protein COHA_001172 [Chlorella ohadii]|uniref:ABC transporter domain-containing protein n=1 Tax=Chlorella ohadii TaxID=2649997 RepID=A0AAD5H661_9CHLO|nr:hypothetical protein COHA_001172 [Chlorella ohadii]